MNDYAEFEKLFGGATANFAGTDIVAYGVVGNEKFPLAQISSIQLSVVRQVGPQYLMGRVDPIGIVKGTRAISGTMTMVAFDRDSLLEYNAKALTRQLKSGTLLGWTSRYNEPYINIVGGDIESAVSGKYYLGGDVATIAEGRYNYTVPEVALWRADQALQGKNPNSVGMFDPVTIDKYPDWLQYADQCYPFDIVIMGANEMGANMSFRIFGVQFASEAISLGISDLMIEKPYNFLARGVSRMKPGITKKGELYRVSPTREGGIAAMGSSGDAGFSLGRS